MTTDGPRHSPGLSSTGRIRASGADVSGNHRRIRVTDLTLRQPDEDVGAEVLALRDLILQRPGSSSQKSGEPHPDLAEAAADLIFIIDLTGRIEFINRAAAEVLAVTVEELVGQPFEGLPFLPEPEEAEGLLARVIMNEEVVHYEIAVDLSAGTEHFYTTLSPVKDADGLVTGVLGIAKDVSELARAREELRSLSLVDDLTGLYNRRGFTSLARQYLSLAKRNSKRVCLVMADMDNLKGINDRFGHHQGDVALTRLASILKDNCRQSDVVARIGGDEFVILASGVSEGGLEVLVSRLLQAVKAENQRGQHPYPFSASIGAIECPPNSLHSIDELLAAVDKRMYEVKRARAR